MAPTKQAARHIDDQPKKKTPRMPRKKVTPKSILSKETHTATLDVPSDRQQNTTDSKSTKGPGGENNGEQNSTQTHSRTPIGASNTGNGSTISQGDFEFLKRRLTALEGDLESQKKQVSKLTENLKAERRTTEDAKARKAPLKRKWSGLEYQPPHEKCMNMNQQLCCRVR